MDQNKIKNRGLIVFQKTAEKKGSSKEDEKSKGKKSPVSIDFLFSNQEKDKMQQV